MLAAKLRLQCFQDARNGRSQTDGSRLAHVIPKLLLIFHHVFGFLRKGNLFDADIEMVMAESMAESGQALALDLTFVTHNTREFSRVTGLRLEDWEKE